MQRRYISTSSFEPREDRHRRAPDQEERCGRQREVAHEVHDGDRERLERDLQPEREPDEVRRYVGLLVGRRLVLAFLAFLAYRCICRYKL